MKMIKLTNTGPRAGQALYINPDHITAAFPSIDDAGKQETNIYSGYTPEGLNWKVKESVAAVIKLINGADNK